MESKHDIIIMVIVGVIICFQLALFYQNLNRILAFKKIISKNENISLVELTIDENIATSLDPETILNDMDDLDIQNNKIHDYDSEQIESFDKSDEKDND